jgi:hypothetical protein
MIPAAHTFVPLEGLAAISPNVTHHADGLRGSGSGFAWHTTFTPAHDGTWVETTLTTDRELVFSPAMIVWLGELDNLNDRQAHTWRQTILRAPTVNQQGLGGNDLPAGYLYDHDRRIETIVYYPPDSLRWAPHRFYELTLREVIEYRPSARYGIGMIPTATNADFQFSPGTHTFRFWYRQARVESIPDPWAAQRALLDAIAPLLDTQPALIPTAPDWDTMARGTLDDLSDDACWVDTGGKTGLRAYVKGSSAVGRDDPKGFELMTQLDVLLPLLHWRARTGEKGADAIIDRLMEAVRAYRIIAPHHYLPNHYPNRPTETFMDTWYFYENALIKLPWVAHLTGDSDLKSVFLTALEGGRELARNTGYLMPLFADAQSWKPRGSLLNVSVSGMYAAGCLLAHQMTGADDYWSEAVAALNALAQLPPHLLTHEPQQLSFAAAAAAYLGDSRQAADLVDLSLRMGYWASDPAVTFFDPRGMFQACASLCYPAYKENVEVIWAWSELLRTPGIREIPRLPGLMAAFANLQRCHNYAFFDPFLPESLRRGPCPHVPYEDLATAEFTHTAKLGKELYGAGEVFFSALLFSRPDWLIDLPPDVLTFSLDVPCVQLTQPADAQPRWLVYNPRAAPVEIRSTQIDFALDPHAYHIVGGA